MKSSTVEALWREHNEHALKSLRHQLRGTVVENAEDALADAWVILARKPDDWLEEARNLRAWVVTVARNRALEPVLHPRDAADRRIGGDDGDVFDWLDSHNARDPLTELLHRDTRRELLALINAPDEPPRRRGLAVTPSRRAGLLFLALGLSYQQAMQATGWTYTKVNRAITEARMLARERGLDQLA